VNLTGQLAGVGTMKEERRKTPRALVEHLVSYTVLDERGETDEMGMARTLDLSEGGIVLEMTHSLDRGSHVEMKMVSGDHILEARGLVVYSKYLPDYLPNNRWRVGVSFTEITDGDLATIAQEVELRRLRKTRGDA